MKPLVSILIPAYNAAPWLAASIESALAQTWPRIEIVIVDDGSTDNTLPIARKFASANVLVVTQPNSGASVARTKALSFCQGDYIQWLDADDLLATDKISNQLEQSDTVSRLTLLSSAWGRFYFRQHKARYLPNSLWDNLSPVDWLVRKFEDNAWMAINSWLVSRTLAEAAGPWNTQLTLDDDGEYFARLVQLSDGIKFVPEARSLVRRASFTSLSAEANLTSAKLRSQFRSMTLQIGYLLSLEDSVRTRHACVSYLQNWLLYFYPECEDIVCSAKEMAREFGGELSIPTLKFKYEVVRSACGWRAAKKARFALPQAKAWLNLNIDKCLFHLGV